MKNSKTNYSYIEGIVYSKQFRNLQDKTQLFYSAPKRQVRTRLTHTIEVKIIAQNIGQKINRKYKKHILDLNLIDAIALAHDIGHTPFGHVGERTIDEIVSKKDTLGGLICDNHDSKMRFKHNVNSMRILEELEIKDWRIIDGALCHTRIFYKNDNVNYSINPYNPFEEKTNKIRDFIYAEHDILTNRRKKPHSLTLEGQIVAVADEIAQRVADISDGLESRYFEKIQKILGVEEKLHTHAELEQFIRSSLIDDVVSNTISNLKQHSPQFLVNSGISHTVYYQEIVSFSESMKTKNNELEEYITTIMAQSEVVRESDSRSKYIIRQLFKAYLNDVSLLPDEFIDGYFGKIINKKSFQAAIRALENEQSNDEDAQMLDVLYKIHKQSWKIDKWNLPQNIVVIRIDLVKKYFDLLRLIMRNSQRTELNLLFDEYILKVGFYIASLTNSEAFNAYNRIYGH